MMEYRDDAFEDLPPRRMVVLPWLVWAGTIAASIVIALQLTGCAQVPQKMSSFYGVCALQPAGMTDSGIAVFHTYCEARE